MSTFQLAYKEFLNALFSLVEIIFSFTYELRFGLGIEGTVGFVASLNVLSHLVLFYKMLIYCIHKVLWSDNIWEVWN